MQPHVSGWNESAYYSTDCLQKVHLWRSVSGSNEPLYYLTQEDQVMMCAFDQKKSLTRLSSVYVLLHHLFVAGIAGKGCMKAECSLKWSSTNQLQIPSHWSAETDYTKIDKPSSGCLPVLVHMYKHWQATYWWTSLFCIFLRKGTTTRENRRGDRTENTPSALREQTVMRSFYTQLWTRQIQHISYAILDKIVKSCIYFCIIVCLQASTYSIGV